LKTVPFECADQKQYFADLFSLLEEKDLKENARFLEICE
jgi:hypothetical protein